MEHFYDKYCCTEGLTQINSFRPLSNPGRQVLYYLILQKRKQKHRDLAKMMLWGLEPWQASPRAHPLHYHAALARVASTVTSLVFPHATGIAARHCAGGYDEQPNLG